MHFERVDELPKRVNKTGFRKGDIYEQLKTVVELGYKYTKVTAIPGEYASDRYICSTVANCIERYSELKSIFRVELRNGDTYLIRTDLE
jgi:hypothetical protein